MAKAIPLRLSHTAYQLAGYCGELESSTHSNSCANNLPFLYMRYIVQSMEMYVAYTRNQSEKHKHSSTQWFLILCFCALVVCVCAYVCVSVSMCALLCAVHLCYFHFTRNSTRNLAYVNVCGIFVVCYYYVLRCYTTNGRVHITHTHTQRRTRPPYHISLYYCCKYLPLIINVHPINIF